MGVRAVLFDVGGPLNTEVVQEQLIEDHIRRALMAEGISVTDADYREASDWAVSVYVAAADAAILWRLTNGNQALCDRIYRDLIAAVNEQNVFELRPGTPELLARIRSRGVRLGLAANQPHSTIERLDSAGLGHFFSHRKVSDTHGFHKPDLRLFLDACAELQVDPASCLMVGDRIDNDVAPARALGMRTVLFRTGRHRRQMPRSAQEVPDAEVVTVDELDAAIFREIDG